MNGINSFKRSYYVLQVVLLVYAYPLTETEFTYLNGLNMTTYCSKNVAVYHVW
jgi:hypothetical protein